MGKGGREGLVVEVGALDAADTSRRPVEGGGVLEFDDVGIAAQPQGLLREGVGGIPQPHDAPMGQRVAHYDVAVGTVGLHLAGCQRGIHNSRLPL